MRIYVIKKPKTSQTCVTEQLIPESQLCARDLWLESAHVPAREQFVHLRFSCNAIAGPAPPTQSPPLR